MGPLTGLRVIEMAGIGPLPFAGMMLSDLGAEVIRLERQSTDNANIFETTQRGRKSIALNLKTTEGVALALQLIATADILIEGFRPGVMEKLGLSPDACLAVRPQLVFGRMTGWGQTGPLAHTAGHDINYIAITGALDAIGREQGGPVPPLNLLGDFGGGGAYLVMGVLAALYESQKTGQGQVVDAAITDGVASLMTMIQGYQAMGMWEEGRQNNIFDGGPHYYDTYECADEKWVSIGAIEVHFYAELVEKLALDVGEISYPAQFDKALWKSLKPKIAEKIKTKTQAEWCEIFADSDACFAPVLSMQEAYDYPHNQHRQTFVEIEGVTQAAPAPKFSKTKPLMPRPPVAQGADTELVLSNLGLTQAEIIAYKKQGVIS